VLCVFFGYFVLMEVIARTIVDFCGQYSATRGKEEGLATTTKEAN
jgi:hypothetical protein